MKKRTRIPILALSGLIVALLFSLAPMASNHGSDGMAKAFAVTESLATSDSAAPDRPAAVVTHDLLGLSGRLRAVMGTPEALDRIPVVKSCMEAVERAVWPRLATPDGDSFTVVTLIPLDGVEGTKYGSYRVGSWPKSALTATSRYTPPSGFIGVTEENQGTSLSESFTMRDFLTHDQGNVWPKVLVVQPRLLDKLELLRAELEKAGLPSRLHIMSGFRTPQYNAQGVGKGGRASHSRHMYGDAADVFVDADGNGRMDDLDRDGKVTVADARVLREAAERVEAEYPALVGGLSAYPANSAHGPFVHVDARGFRARW